MSRLFLPDLSWKTWAILAALLLSLLLPLTVLDTRARGLLINTLLVSGSTCAIGLPLGTFLALVLARTDLPLRRVWLILVSMLLFVPVYLQAAAWQAGFGLQGVWTLGAGGEPWLEGMRGAVWVHAMAGLPWVVLIVGVGLRRVEPELEELALLDASPLNVLMRVTLPGAAGAIGLAALWLCLMASTQIAATDLFGVRTYAEEVYTESVIGPPPGAIQGSFEAPLGLLSVLILAAPLGLLGVVFLGALAPGRRLDSPKACHVFRLGTWRIPMVVLVVAVGLALLGVPLANLCHQAGIVVTQTESGRVREWSVVKFAGILLGSLPRYRTELSWSLLISSLAATLSVGGSLAMAWWARSSRWRTGLMLLLAAFCLALPGPMIGRLVIWLLNRPQWPTLVYLYDRTVAAPVLAILLRVFPLTVLILWHALHSFPQETLDAASIDGAGRIRQLLRIVLPSRRAAIGLAWLVAFAVGLGDLAATILVAPPGMTTLAVRIFGLLHYGVEDRVAGICLVLALALAGMSLGIVWLAGRWNRE